MEYGTTTEDASRPAAIFSSRRLELGGASATIVLSSFRTLDFVNLWFVYFVQNLRFIYSVRSRSISRCHTERHPENFLKSFDGFPLHVLSVRIAGRTSQIMHAGWADSPMTVLRSVLTTEVLNHTFV